MQTDQPFTYLVPENLNEQLAVGMREVPLVTVIGMFKVCSSH